MSEFVVMGPTRDGAVNLPIAILKKNDLAKISKTLQGEGTYFAPNVALNIKRLKESLLWEEVEPFDSGTRVFQLKQNKEVEAVFRPGEELIFWHIEKIPVIKV